MTGTVLILGNTGRFGRHAAAAFWNAGWHLRVFDRQRDDLETAARGADVIVNGWNPPYPDWAAQLPGLTASVIGAARASGATVLLPGNLYVYGAGAPSVLGPDTPHAATNPLGRLRIEMEAAYRRSGVPTIVLRAGDYLDTEPSGNWFDRVIAKTLDRGVLTSPGDPDAAHAWAFLPDLARVAVALSERRTDLPGFADLSFAGFTLSIREMAALLPGHPRVTRMSWTPIHLCRPVWPMARHLVEMGYLWSKPHRVDGDPLAAILPEFRPTDPAEALLRASAFARRPSAKRAA